MRIFAYLRPDYPRFTETLNALKQLAVEVVVHCPGIPADYAASIVSDRLTFIFEPMDMKQVIERFSLVVSHAGHGTSLALLLGGRAHFMLPANFEQLMNARAVSELGAGRFIDREDSAAAIDIELKQILDNTKMAEAAREFSDRYTGFEPEKQITGISSRILELLKNS